MFKSEENRVVQAGRKVIVSQFSQVNAKHRSSPQQ